MSAHRNQNAFSQVQNPDQSQKSGNMNARKTSEHSCRYVRPNLFKQLKQGGECPHQSTSIGETKVTGVNK